MARFQSSHSRRKNQIGTQVIRLLLLMVILAVLLVLFQKKVIHEILFQNSNYSWDNADERFYLPESEADTIIHFQYYSSGISREMNRPIWVAYELNRSHLIINESCKTDPAEESTVTYADRKYIETCLVPEADRSFNCEALREVHSIYNKALQSAFFRNSIWRELEEQVRLWVSAKGQLIILCGPLINDSVVIPNTFFKIVLDMGAYPPQGIGFLLPYDMISDSLPKFVVPIDQIEEKSGIDFFHQLFTDTLEEQIEIQVNMTHWPFSEK